MSRMILVAIALTLLTLAAPDAAADGGPSLCDFVNNMMCDAPEQLVADAKQAADDLKDGCLMAELC